MTVSVVQKAWLGLLWRGGVWLLFQHLSCLIFGSSQPKPRAGRRKHIADGLKGAVSRGASNAKVCTPASFSSPVVMDQESFCRHHLVSTASAGFPRMVKPVSPLALW